MQALLVAHDADESAVLTLVLQRAGFSVRSVRDFERVILSWPEQPIELFLLTIKKSHSIAHIASQVSQMRAQSDLPVVLVSDPLEEDAQIALLEAGADLLITRPYSARLMIAQLRALLRRNAGVPFFSLPTLEHRGLTLDPSARTVQVNESAPVRLTQLEFRLLYTLMIHPGQVIPAETLVEHVWGYNGQGDRDLVRGLVRRLRSKVEPNSQSPVYIQTVPGVGYVLQS
jgi:DNA-binding response OmpR family regulator